MGAVGEGFPGVGAPGIRDGVEEGFLALEEDDDAGAEGFAEAPGETDEQGVGEKDDIRTGEGAKPGDEIVEFAGLMALFTAEHGEVEFADIGGAGLGGLAGSPFEEAGRIEEGTEPGRGGVVAGDFLGEEDVDAAEEGGGVGVGGGFVEGHWQVEGHHDGIVPLPAEGGHEGIVTETISAIHAAGPGGDLDEVHPAWEKVPRTPDWLKPRPWSGQVRIPWAFRRATAGEFR